MGDEKKSERREEGRSKKEPIHFLVGCEAICTELYMYIHLKKNKKKQADTDLWLAIISV
jgi:hypothetical protein